MDKVRLFRPIGSLTLIAALILTAVAHAAGPKGPAKPEKNKPVRATNVQLVKKISLKGRPAWAGGGKGKKKQGVATGVLGEAVEGSRYAVVVGISDYPGTANDLNYSDDDAEEMNQALQVYGFINVELLTDAGATRTAILNAVANIPTEAGEIVFFFSGHGMRGMADDGDKERIDEAIVAHDGTELVPIWDGELKAAFSGFTASRIVFIFDMCLAGGMEKDLEGSGRLVIGAASERGDAYEGDAWQNGEFSHYFVDVGILQGKANVHDYDLDEVVQEPEQVTMEEAFDYARTACQYDKPVIDDQFENDLLP